MLVLPQPVLAAVFFHDSFGNGVTTLDTFTPDIGTSWTSLITVGSGEIVACTGGTVGADPGCNGGPASNDSGSLYTADATYSSADYSVQVTINDVNAGDDASILAARVQDTNNMYAVKLNGLSGGQMYKKVSGTWTAIGSSFSNPTAGSVMKFIVNGSTISVEDDGTTVASTTDTDISAAGKAGLAIGAIITSSDDENNQQFDNFTVRTITAEEYISGNVYSDEGTTALGSQTVRVAINGTDQATTDDSLAGTGAWIVDGLSISAGDVITVYLEEVTVTVYRDLIYIRIV